MDAPLKLCIDCVFMQRNWLFECMCHAPEIVSQETIIDPVTGREHIRVHHPLVCREVRRENSLCGMAANFFEPKFKE